MQNFGRMIANSNARSFLLQAGRLGYSQTQLKEAVIEVLTPHFEDKTIPETYGVSLLVPDAIMIAQLSEVPSAYQFFEEALQMYRLAGKVSHSRCMEVCGEWNAACEEAISRFWSLSYLELDKNQLGRHEFVHECLRNIGEIIEGVAKPYLGCLVHQLRIKAGAATSYAEVARQDLGALVDEVFRGMNCTDAMAPAGVRLGQWRNIAYHHTARLTANEIVCEYGPRDSRREIRLQPEELLQVVRSVIQACAALKQAYNIFFTDNVTDILPHLPPVESRPESQLIGFIAGLHVLGFEPVDFQFDSAEAVLVVKDTVESTRERSLHASQFVMTVWSISHATRVKIEYQDQNSALRMTATASGEDCAGCASGALTIEDIACRVRIELF